MDTQMRTCSKFPLIFDGKLGQEIYEYIINTPKSDLTELYKEVELEEKRRLGDVKNGAGNIGLKKTVNGKRNYNR